MNAEDLKAEKAKAWATYIHDAVAASPDKVAIIFVKGHHEKTGPGASRFATTDQNGWDHVAAAWRDKDGNLVFRDMTPTVDDAGIFGSKSSASPSLDDAGIFGSKNSAKTLDELVKEYAEGAKGEVEAIPLNLSKLSAGFLDLAPLVGALVRAQFVDALEKQLAPDKTYSFLQNGTTCSSAIGLAIATIDPEFGKFGNLDVRGLASTALDLSQQYLNVPAAVTQTVKWFIPELTLNTVAPWQVHDWARAHSTLEYKYSPEDGKGLPSGQSAPAITDTSPIELQAAHSGLAAEGVAALRHAGVPDFMIKNVFPGAPLELGDQTGQSAPAITDTSAIELQAAHSGLAAEGAAALQHAGVPEFMIENDIFVFPALAAPEASGAPGAPLELDDHSGLPVHWGETASHIALGDPVPQQDSLPAEAFLDAGLLGQSVAHHSDFLVV